MAVQKLLRELGLAVPPRIPPIPTPSFKFNLKVLHCKETTALAVQNVTCYWEKQNCRGCSDGDSCSGILSQPHICDDLNENGKEPTGKAYNP